MHILLILGFAVFTSALGYLFGKVLRLSDRSLATALGALLECMGACLVFLVLNVLVMFLGILMLRRVTDVFLSPYVANDLTLLVVSLFQGLTFHLWRRGDTARSKG